MGQAVIPPSPCPHHLTLSRQVEIIEATKHLSTTEVRCIPAVQEILKQYEDESA